MQQPRMVMACVGKGGAGKTLVSALCGGILRQRGARVLFMDADPVGGLSFVLGSGPYPTVAQVRERMIAEARSTTTADERDDLRALVDHLLLNAVVERDGYGVMVLGQSQGLGCFCGLNKVLRATLSSITHAFDVVVVDAEAGIEQINRQVMESVDRILVVSDPSQRGLNAARLAAATTAKVPGMERAQVGLVLNKCDNLDGALRQAVTESGLPLWGVVPTDHVVAGFDRDGRSLLELPEDSVARGAVQTMVDVLDLWRSPS